MACGMHDGVFQWMVHVDEKCRVSVGNVSRWDVPSKCRRRLKVGRTKCRRRLKVTCRRRLEVGLLSVGDVSKWDVFRVYLECDCQQKCVSCTNAACSVHGDTPRWDDVSRQGTSCAASVELTRLSGGHYEELVDTTIVWATTLNEGDCGLLGG